MSIPWEWSDVTCVLLHHTIIQQSSVIVSPKCFCPHSSLAASKPISIGLLQTGCMGYIDRAYLCFFFHSPDDRDHLSLTDRILCAGQNRGVIIIIISTNVSLHKHTLIPQTTTYSTIHASEYFPRKIISAETKPDRTR